ncbi:T9SS type A sorting domain-containing protein, partial [bacterium]|nr:T9SS type A sorting domain-containing protein [bacterium]
VSYSFVNDTYVWGTYDSMWPDFDPGYGSDPTGLNDLRPCFGNAYGKWYLEASSWPYNPSNKDETYFLFHHHGDAFMTLYSEVPQNLNVVHDGAILGGQSDFTVTADADALIGLSVDGEYLAAGVSTGAPTTLSFDPLLPGQTMHVTVTKANYYRYMSGVPVVPPSGPYVSFNSVDVNDAIVGNNNGQWDFSENVNLTVEVKNIGVSTANDVNVNIVTEHPEITVVDGVEAYGNIAAGDSVSIANGFEVQSSTNIVDGELITFILTATSGAESWESYFAVPAYSPVVTFDNLVIDDPTGNNNGALDPGETADLDLTLLNDGHTVAGNVVLTLTNDNPDVTITGSPANYGSIIAGATAMQSFVLVADAGMASGVVVTFTMDIVADNGYVTSETFDILVGDERNLPSGPDAYGYLAWDNLDGGQGHPYNWVEIAPSQGGPGTLNGPTSDDQTVQVTLPFTFTYYGQNFNNISICSNGWIAIGSQTSTDYSNSGIPNSDGPGNMIALNWDDLHPGYGGTEICTYYDAANHYFVVEYYNISHYGTGGSQRDTFQGILYDPAYYSTATGDGIVLCQYHTVSDFSSSTFGIENSTETIGLQYGFDGSWDTHAWVVEPGRSITYTTGEAGTAEFTCELNYTSGSPVPPTGGNVYYSIYIENIGASAANFDGWLDVSYEGGVPTLIALRAFTGFLPGWAINRPDMFFPVPAAYAPGNYSFGGHVGTYPGTVLAEDFFSFTKTGDFDGEFIPFVPDGVPNPFDRIDTGDLASMVPDEYEILGSYPNPFNPTATISYALPEAGKVSLKVFDISGRMVTELVNSQREAGYHEATFEASGLASGVYIYQLKVNDFTANGKMILMK